jgi:hypothetical protein
MSLSSRLKALGVAAAILAGAVAAAQVEVIASEFDASPAVNAVIKVRPAPIGHRRPPAGDMLHDVRQDAVVQDAVARNEEEFDRRFGMCRRC